MAAPFAPPDKRRPVVVISRKDAIDVISTVLVAPVTSTDRGLSSVHAIRKADLSRCVATLGPGKMTAICRAMSVAIGCS